MSKKKKDPVVVDENNADALSEFDYSYYSNTI